MKKLLVSAALMLFFSLSGVWVSAASEGILVAYKTNEGITVDGLPEERFWSQAPWTKLALKPSDGFGGAVKELDVKVAHNDSWIFILANWHDPTESRRTDPVVRNPKGGYFYNNTYYYGDILWVDWSLANGGSTKPAVDPWGHTRFAGTPGSGRAGLEANLWSWRSYWDSGGPTYPYHYFPPSVYTWGPKAGQPLIIPYSSAYDSYLNATAQYFVGTGVMRVEACAAPFDDLDPFVVRAKGAWSNNTWTVEIARPFTSPPNTSNKLFDVQLSEGRNYWVGFVVADGNKGEVYNTNSVSEWVNIEISPQLYQPEAQVAKIANVTQYVAYGGLGVLLVAIATASFLLIRRNRTRR